MTLKWININLFKFFHIPCMVFPMLFIILPGSECKLAFYSIMLKITNKKSFFQISFSVNTIFMNIQGCFCFSCISTFFTLPISFTYFLITWYFTEISKGLFYFQRIQDFFFRSKGEPYKISSLSNMAQT